MFSVSRSGGRSRLPSLEPSSLNRPRSSSVVPNRLSSNAYSRESYGGWNGRRTSSEERKSSSSAMKRFSGAGIRASSGVEQKGVLKETRPLTDKAYQKKKSSELFDFLLENNFSPQMTLTKLMQPSKKDYELIIQFLVRFFEPTFEVKNLEEDATRILKNLSYPFIPNKSVFQYVARTHYSALLGVLVFLLDIAKFSLNLNMSMILKDSLDKAVPMSYLLEFSIKNVPIDENMEEFFRETILNIDGTNFSDLQKEVQLNKEKLENVEKELESIELLKVNSIDLDSRIKRYGEYFLEMTKCKAKKEAAISELLDNLQKKNSAKQELEDLLNNKQTVYDNQGFDGKKHLSHFEQLKKELNEVLQEKKTKLREIQDECWELELSYSRNLDKDAGLCDVYNRLYTPVRDSFKANFQTLLNIKDPEVEKTCNSLRVEFPDLPMELTPKTLLAWIEFNRESLENIQTKMHATSLNLKTLISATSEMLAEIEMKKLHLEATLQCSSSTVFQKEQDLANLTKKVVEEVKALKEECDKSCRDVETIRKENRDFIEKRGKLEADLLQILKIKASKVEMLEKIEKDKKEFFDLLVSKLEASAQESEALGEEVFVEAQKMVARYKEEIKNL